MSLSRETFRKATGLTFDPQKLLDSVSEEKKAELYKKLSWTIGKGKQLDNPKGTKAQLFAETIVNLAQDLNLGDDLNGDGVISEAEQKIINEIVKAKEIQSSVSIETEEPTETLTEPVTEPVTETPMTAEEFLALFVEGGVIDLNADLDLVNTCAVVTKDVTINLNGHNIDGGIFTESSGNIVEGTSDSYVFWVKNGAKLTINGDGILTTKDATYSMCVWLQSGSVEINGGKYINAGDGCDLIYLSGTSTLVINDGEFVATKKLGVEAGTANVHSTINIQDKSRANCTVEVKGGKFVNFNPSNNVSEGQDTNFVSSGYKVQVDEVDNNELYTSDLGTVIYEVVKE